MDPNSAQGGDPNTSPPIQPEDNSPTPIRSSLVPQDPMDYNRYIGTTPSQRPVEETQQPESTISQPQTETKAATEAPAVFTSTTDMVDKPPEGEKKSRKGLVSLIFSFIIIILLTGAGGLTWAVAYEKIKLEKYPDLQKKVSAFVMELPFTPKTPKFLLAKTAMAHQDITKQAFDISMAIDSADLVSQMGLTNLDVQAKGAFDYSDPKNVFGNLELTVTKDFQLELRKKDEFLYFKINKLPSFLLAFLGISTAQFDPIIDRWVSYDTTPLDTEARRNIQQDKEVDPLSEEFLNENFDKYVDEEVLTKMKLSSVEEDGRALYKIEVEADGELIDHFGEKLDEASRQRANYAYPSTSQTESDKLSDFVKDLKWEIYIDKDTYYTRKVTVIADMEYDQSQGLSTFVMDSANPLAQKNKATISFAMKFDKFGEEVMVEAPSSAMSFEEFTELLSTTLNEIYGSAFENNYSQTRDARRKSDLMSLRSALELYKSDCAKYPENLEDLKSTKKDDGCTSEGWKYTSLIPTDPSGDNYFYETNGSTYDLCANLEVTPTTTTTCPDSSYNYHVTRDLSL